MEEQSKEKLQPLDLQRLLRNFSRILKRVWWIALILSLLLGGYRFFGAYRSFTPMYRASASFSVRSGFMSSTDLVDTTQYYNSQATQQVVSSFSYIISSEAMQERIRMDLGTPYINGTPRAEGVGDTNLFTLSVTSNKPEDAYNILQSVIQNYPQVASFVIGDTQLLMIEEPILPTHPINEFHGVRTAVMGFVMGLILCGGLMVVLALFHKTVMSTNDLKDSASVPCLGTLPQIEAKRRRKAQGVSVSVLNANLGETLTAPMNAIQVRLLRKHRDTEDHRRCQRVVMVTSTMPNEGKTTVSFNLAASLAQNGHRVVLVDADLRHQAIKQRFGITEETTGLLELSRQACPDVERAVSAMGQHPNLWLLAGDTRTNSPMAVLDSPKMEQIMDRLRELFDYVIIDAPPAGLLADAALLCHSADQVLYVIHYDGVTQNQVVDSMESLDGHGAKLAGFVLNGVPGHRSGYGYGYGYGYGSKYGYGHYGSYGSYGEEHRKHSHHSAE